MNTWAILRKTALPCGCLMFVTDESVFNRFGVIWVSRTKDTFPLIFSVKTALTCDQRNDFAKLTSLQQKLAWSRRNAFSTKGTTTLERRFNREKPINTKVVVDTRYRPVLSGLTGCGWRENRFVSNEPVTQHLLIYHAIGDLWSGTKEEFHIAWHEDTIEVKRIRPCFVCWGW